MVNTREFVSGTLDDVAPHIHLIRLCSAPSGAAEINGPDD